MVLPSILNKKILNEKKCYDLLNFVTFKKLQQNSAPSKVAVQAFKAGDSLNIFLKFWGFFLLIFL